MLKSDEQIHFSKYGYSKEDLDYIEHETANGCFFPPHARWAVIKRNLDGLENKKDKNE
ncbi:MAG: hypothetical protein AAB815_00870 [Patescibacteria group bacterium]